MMDRVGWLCYQFWAWGLALRWVNEVVVLRFFYFCAAVALCALVAAALMASS